MEKNNLLKKITGISLALTLLVGIGTSSASALTINDSTKATVGVSAGTIIEPPIDPEKPGGNEGGNVDPAEGFGIWVKPSTLEFNDIQASTNSQSVDLKTDKKDRLISVVDVRGTKAGWTLEANMSVPTSTTDAAEQLTGSSISWDGRSGVHSNPDTSLYINDSSEVTAPASVSLTDSNQKILNADEGKGQGYYGLEMNDVKLNVLGDSGTKGHVYESTINWTLNDTPIA